MGCPSQYDVSKHGSTGKVTRLRFESDPPGSATSNHNIIATVKFDKSGKEEEFWSYGGDVGIAFSRACLEKTFKTVDIVPGKKDAGAYTYVMLDGVKDATAFFEEAQHACTVFIDC